MKKIIILTTLIIAFLSISASEKLTDSHIVGDVKDKTTGEHIPFVTITIKNTNIGTTTDATGHYFLKNMPLGKLTVMVSGVGYKTSEQTVELNSKQTLELNFDVETETQNIDEVVVSANRNETSRKEAPIVVGVLNPKLLQSINSQCVAQGLNFQPGVRVENDCQNCGFNQVRINGLEGPYSQILVDSRPIFSALSGVYGLEQIPTNMLERVEVVRGGGSALFGSNAIGGTINIITKEPITNSFSINHNLELIDNKAADNVLNINNSVVTDDRKVGLYLYGTFRNRQNYDYDGDGYSEVPLLKGSSLGFRSFYKINPQSKLILEYHFMHEFRRGGNRFDFQPHQTDITEQVEHYINGGSLSYNWFSKDNKTKVNAYTSLQNVERKSYYGAGRDTNAYGKTRDLTAVVGAQFMHGFENFIFMPSDLTIGTEYQYDDMEDIMLGYNRDLKQTTKIWGSFIQNEWKNSYFTFLIGGRMDKHNLIKNPIFSPRANIKYNILKDLHFRVSYSSGFRAPQAFDEDLHIAAVGGEVKIIKLAENLKEEKSHSWSSSLDYYFNIGHFQFNTLIEGFYTTLKDVFVLSETGTDSKGNIVMTRSNGSGAKVYGTNFEGKMAHGKEFQFQFGLTFQKSLYNEAQAWSTDPSVEATKTMLRSPNQYGYFSLTTEPLKNFQFNLSGTYTGQMKLAHMAGYIPNDKLETSPNFFDMNFKTSYDFKLQNSLTLQIGVGMKNIFNSYQSDFDKGGNRDSGYIYGPSLPRSTFFSIKITNL